MIRPTLLWGQARRAVLSKYFDGSTDADPEFGADS